MADERLFELIHDYLDHVGGATERLQLEFSEAHLLQGWRSGRIEQYGRLTSGDEYSFHGVGCRYTSDNITVDFEFEIGGGTGGFDAWRLWLFAENFPHKYPEFQARATVESRLAAALIAGNLTQRGTSTNRALCYVK